MATREELREALDNYVALARANERAQRTLKGWSCVLHLRATDLGAAFTMVIQNGEVAEVKEGADGPADLIISGSSEDLAAIFWGEANPASNYMQGAITTQGSQEDVMRLDAMAMFIFLGK